MESWFRINTKKIIALILCAEALFFVLPRFLPSVFQPGAILVSQLNDLTNDQRIANDALPLTVSPLLTEAAQLKANDEATNEYFAHVSPTGVTPWHWLDIVGYTYNYAGENLAINFTNSQDVTTAWMNSPSHRANIVKAAYTQIGTAIATGTYQGHATIFVVQLFGNPVALNATNTMASVVPAKIAVATTTATHIGQVLGTSTSNTATTAVVTIPQAIAPIDLQKLATPIAQSPTAMNNILLGILGILICILLFNTFAIFSEGIHIIIRSIVSISIIIVLLWLININVLKNNPLISSTFNYSKEQVVKLPQ